MHTFCLQYKVCIPFSSGDPAEGVSVWCTEKQHSMVHWASNRRTVGRPSTISTNVTESRMKTAVKTKAKKTNNQALFGSSILKATMEVDVAIQLAHDLDVTCVCIGFVINLYC